MKNHDPRLGLPSASSMHRVAQCPGSVALSNSLRASGKLYECRDPDAESGTRIHQWLASEFIGGEPVALDARELPVALKCAQLRETLIKEWLGGNT